MTNQDDCEQNPNGHEPNVVFKDNDITGKIRLSPERAQDIVHQLHEDTNFLRNEMIMDYSLLVGT